MSTCLAVQHVAPESLYAIGDALVSAGVELDTRQVFAGDAVPDDVRGFDGLVVMGGPMSAASDEDFPSRRAELSLIASAVRAGIPTLGVCLGAQLVAAACGAAVYRGEKGPEIGWSPVTLSNGCGDDALFSGLPDTLNVLQWHGDTFDLPVGARLLMSNGVYPNQAFRIGEAAWGLQFHLEVSEAAVDHFVRAFGADAAGAPGGSDNLRAATPSSLAALCAPRELVLERFARLVSTGTGQVVAVQDAAHSA
jgi:GMP synthase-like glutamine amidotransferase